MLDFKALWLQTIDSLATMKSGKASLSQVASTRDSQRQTPKIIMKHACADPYAPTPYDTI